MNPLHAGKKPSDLIRQGWTQGSYAKTGDNMKCDSFSPEAAKWCIIGAISACPRYGYGYGSIDKLAAILPDTVESVASWNDAPGRTQAEVIELLEKAGL